jgi:hypothetical protein
MNNNEMTVIDLENLDVENFKLGKSGRAVKLLYNKEPVQICTSTLYCPFGVKFISKEWSNFTEYYIDCFLNNSKSDVSVNFKKSIENLDELIQKLVKENIGLFNSKTETANDQFLYSPILRENGTYPKLMRLQLTRDKNGNFESFLFDENKQKIPLKESNIENVLCKGKIFKTIIECVKVWYYNGKVGSMWKIVQLKFSEKTITNEPQEQQQQQQQSAIYNQLMIID